MRRGTGMHGSTAARTFAVIALVLLVAVPGASANTIAVDTTQDGFGANGRCGLRDAIQAAQADAASGGCAPGSGADVVALSSGRYDLTIAGANEDANHTGDLDLASAGGALTIQGAGRDLTAIDARHIDRVVDVAAGADVTIQGLEVTGGHAADGATGVDGAEGGGIRNLGGLTLRDSVVDDNAAGNGGAGAAGGPGPTPIISGNGGSSTGADGGRGGKGGGIFNSGALVIERTRIAGNRAGAGGSGGVGGTGGNGFSLTGGQSFSGGNSTGGNGGRGGAGGGIFASLAAHIFQSTLAGNRSGAGGAGGNGGNGGSGTGLSPGGSSLGGIGGAGADGGAIVAGAGSEISDSTVTANEAGDGGNGGTGGFGGYNFAGGGRSTGGAGGSGGSGAGLSGPPSATNVTIAANHAGDGGAGGAGLMGGSQIGGNGISPGGNGGVGGSAGGSDGIALVNATLAGNGAGAGGTAGAAGSTGGGPGATGAAGVAGAARNGSLENSITASNGASGCDPGAGPADAGGNITFQSGAACPGTVADPGLAPLADNGGATLSMAPALPGPAIDARVAGGCPPADQRGVARPIGAGCDAGAYEAGVTVSTGDATVVTLDSAALPGALTPTLRPTSFHFEYGTSTAYGSATPITQAASRIDTTDVGVTIAGLQPSTAYHYRLVAVNPDATVAFAGADKTFTTAAAPAPQDQPAPATGGGPANGSPVHAGVFVIDSGAALARLDRHNHFKLPGLRFSCPSDASGKCTAKISIVAGASGARAARELASARMTVARGKPRVATLKASKRLVALAKRKGFVALTARTTLAMTGQKAVSVKKAFVLLKRRR